MSLRKKIPAEEWQKIKEHKKLVSKFPSKFLFGRYTCGVCKSGIRFQTAWKYYHDDEEEGGYGYTTFVFSFICKHCAHTREQLVFLSLNFPKDIPKYHNTIWYS